MGYVKLTLGLAVLGAFLGLLTGIVASAVWVVAAACRAARGVGVRADRSPAD